MFYHLAKFATKNQKIFELPSFYVVKIFYKGKIFFKKYERAGAQSKKPYNTLFWGNPGIVFEIQNSTKVQFLE